MVIWKISLTGHTKVLFAKADNTIWKGPHQCFLTLNLRSESKGQDGGSTSKKRLKGSAWDVKIIHGRRKLLKSPSSLLSCLEHISLLCSSKGNQPLSVLGSVYLKFQTSPRRDTRACRKNSPSHGIHMLRSGCNFITLITFVHITCNLLNPHVTHQFINFLFNGQILGLYCLPGALQDSGDKKTEQNTSPWPLLRRQASNQTTAI